MKRRSVLAKSLAFSFFRNYHNCLGLGVMVIVLCATGCSHGEAIPSATPMSYNRTASPQYAIADELEFKSVLSGNARLDDGTPYSFHLNNGSRMQYPQVIKT